MENQNFCLVFEELLGDYVEGDLSDKLTQEFDLHLGGCQECRNLKNDYELIIATARSLHRFEVTDDIRLRLRKKLEESTGVEL